MFLGLRGTPLLAARACLRHALDCGTPLLAARACLRHALACGTPLLAARACLRHALDCGTPLLAARACLRHALARARTMPEIIYLWSAGRRLLRCFNQNVHRLSRNGIGKKRYQTTNFDSQMPNYLVAYCDAR